MQATSQPRFECPACGSPSVLLPRPLSNDSIVRCRECEKGLGTWLSFQERVAAALKVSGRPVSADPILGG